MAIAQAKPYNTARLLTWGLFAVVLIVAPMIFTSPFSRSMLAQIGIAIVACLSYNVLLGQGGMLSFGHAVYTGLGTFVAVHVMNSIGGGLPIPISLIPLVGGLAGAFFAVILGFVTTKKAGTPFAMITLGLGEIAHLTLHEREIVHDRAGQSRRRQPPARSGRLAQRQTFGLHKGTDFFDRRERSLRSQRIVVEHRINHDRIMAVRVEHHVRKRVSRWIVEGLNAHVESPKGDEGLFDVTNLLPRQACWR